jgi:hypothetical protein
VSGSADDAAAALTAGLASVATLAAEPSGTGRAAPDALGTALDATPRGASCFFEQPLERPLSTPKPTIASWLILKASPGPEEGC